VSKLSLPLGEVISLILKEKERNDFALSSRKTKINFSSTAWTPHRTGHPLVPPAVNTGGA
jgi:hypothetical protein